VDRLIAGLTSEFDCYDFGHSALRTEIKVAGGLATPFIELPFDGGGGSQSA